MLFNFPCSCNRSWFVYSYHQISVGFIPTTPQCIRVRQVTIDGNLFRLRYLVLSCLSISNKLNLFALFISMRNICVCVREIYACVYVNYLRMRLFSSPYLVRVSPSYQPNDDYSPSNYSPESPEQPPSKR